MQAERLRLLQNMPIFGGIRHEILDHLLTVSPIVTMAAGSYFFREHDKGGSMYVLERGTAAVLKTWDSQTFVLKDLGVGDCFGEMSLIDMGPRSADVRATTACSAIEITCAGIIGLYQRDLEQFTLIQMNMGREVSRRLRETDEHLFAGRAGMFKRYSP